jgi:hypothetical protein
VESIGHHLGYVDVRLRLGSTRERAERVDAETSTLERFTSCSLEVCALGSRQHAALERDERGHAPNAARARVIAAHAAVHGSWTRERNDRQASLLARTHPCIRTRPPPSAASHMRAFLVFEFSMS